MNKLVKMNRTNKKAASMIATLTEWTTKVTSQRSFSVNVNNEMEVHVELHADFTYTLEMFGTLRNFETLGALVDVFNDMTKGEF